MIEKYNQDDGMISALNNQTQYYTVNLDTNVADTMVKPFADASRELYSSDGSKDYTLYATPVLSDYGYHFIFCIGVVKNDYNIQPKGWTSESVPSQIKVSVIGDITLYLCKKTKEIEISEEVKEPIVDKSEFNPFFCANNCFNESIKHTPFGILKDSTDKYYTILDISEDGISVLSGNHSVDTISFKFASTFLKYVDGSPFGWL